MDFLLLGIRFSSGNAGNTSMKLKMNLLFLRSAYQNLNVLLR